MKKFFGIAFYITLALSINLKAAMQESTASEIEMPSIEQLESQLKSIIPDERARDILKNYCSSVIELHSQRLIEEELTSKIAQLATTVARDILSYGVNIEALETLIQDPKLNGFFGTLFTEYQHQQLQQPEQTSYRSTAQYSHATTRGLKYADPMYFVKSILPVMEVLLVFLVIVYMIENIPSAQASSGKEIKCALHQLTQGCPCAEFNQLCTRPHDGCVLLLIRCVLHQLSEFLAGNTCPCSN